MGVSRDTFYRVKEAKDSGGMEALLHKDRRRANLKNRVDEQVEQAILAFALENPAAGQVRVSNELRKLDIHVSCGCCSPQGATWIQRLSGKRLLRGPRGSLSVLDRKQVGGARVPLEL